MANPSTDIRDQYDTAITNANRTRATAIAALSRAGTPQTDIIKGTGYSRETVRKLIAEGLAHMADGPPKQASESDPCHGSCPDGHEYDGGCAASPMILGTISPHQQDGRMSWSWRCDGGGGCLGGWLEFGHGTAGGARRAYDRHMKAEHGLSAP